MEKNCGVPTSVPSELTSVLLHGNARVALRENACSRSLCWDQRSGRMRCGLSGTWTFFIGCLMFVAGAGVSIYVNYPLVSYEDVLYFLGSVVFTLGCVFYLAEAIYPPPQPLETLLEHAPVRVFRTASR